MLAADTAKLGHTDDEGECSALAQTRNAHDEIEATGEIAMAAQRGYDTLQLRGPSRFEACDVSHDHASQPRLIDMFETDLEAGDVLLDLFDEGQMLRQLRQALVRLNALLCYGGRASGDQNSIELVVLGPTQMQPSVGFDLDRLQYHNGEAFGPQIADDSSFIAAAGFDADTLDLRADEGGSQTPPACRCILHLPAFAVAMNCDV